MIVPIHTFPARISSGNIVLIVLLLVVTLYMMWHGIGVAIALSLLLLVLVVERTIHSEYRVGGGRIVIHHGRFSKDRVVEVKTIVRIERIRRMRIGGRAWISYLLLVLTDGDMVAVMPRNEDEFLKNIAPASPRGEGL
ncbi:MAG: PH domain-containing protein [Bacteroidaceae bacterium]|nr:PH domain-containing protein [Bacteroidaceae bacterium]MBQ8676227.1 PH domain-containing protein [Bacteroidaceae bacterium]MBQ9175460.1 PH domain-containing protein [Bacteroidaceae bacterium]MBR1378294.1 PH domain-containing protein [Bacteroidaceae bacterium]